MTVTPPPSNSLSFETGYTLTHTLPMHPGYALGGVIHESDYLIPYYTNLLFALNESLEKTKKENEAIKNSEDFKKLKPAEKQTKVVSLSVEEGNISKKVEDIKNEFIIRCTRPSEVMIPKGLPFDENRIKVINKDQSFESERLRSVEFVGTEDVTRRVDNFLNNLFLEESNKSVLPPGTIDSLSKEVKSLLESKASVMIIGSFVTLARVKTVNPLIIPKYATVDSELKKNQAKYLVLYEAVLGGVFLGIGKAFNTVAPGPAEGSADKNLISSLTTVSFISQGAIPKLKSRIDKVNLWEVYCNWKESLTTDPKAGYPIGFKVRALKDVLEDNRRYHEED